MTPPESAGLRIHTIDAIPFAFPMIRLLALLTLLAPAAFAQSGSVTGRVVDSDGDLALPTATVALWQISGADSTLVGGTTTTLDGDFRITSVAAGRYDLVASFVGYESVRLGVEVGEAEVEVGTLRLMHEAETLTEVAVTGERPQVQARIDRTVYDTADDPVAEGGTVTDVLSTLPSVDVDVDGNVSLRGAGNVAVFVNGRPAPVSGTFLASYLQSLPSGSVERVEIIPNPSAAFEPDGVGGIINIVLKENTDAGLGGTLTAGTDTRGGYDATGALTYGSGPWSLAATYGFRNDLRPGGGSGFRINRFEATPTTLTEAETDDRARLSNVLNMSADYSLSRATVLTSQLQLGTRSGDETEIGNTLRSSQSGDPLFEYQRTVGQIEDGRSLDARLGLRQTFGEGHSLVIEGRAERSEETETETYLETLLAGVGDLNPSQRVAQDEAERESALQIDYTRPFLGGRLDAGYKGDWENQSSTLVADTLNAAGVYVANTDVNNEFDYGQTVHALYAQLAREWGALGLQAGVRYEAASTTFDLLTTDDSFDNDYQSFFPSAYLSFAPSQATTFRGGYSRRINRPRSRQLNPFSNFDDPLNLRQGNPALRPEYVDAFEVSVSQITGWGSLSLTPYYRHTTDVIRRFVTIRDDGVTVRTFENLDTSDSYGVEAVSSFENIGGLSGYVSLEGFRLKTDGTTTTSDVGSDGFSWGGRMNATYSLGDRFGLGGLDLQMTARYSAPITTEQARIDSRTFVDLALRQKLLNDQASLTLKVRDPFAQTGFAYTLDQPELFQTLDRTWGGREIGLTFSYSFGQQDRRRDRGPEERDGDGGGGGDGGGEEF